MKNLKKLNILLIIVMIISCFFLPSKASAQENQAVLVLAARNTSGVKVEGVRFNIYEQKTDINGNRILGDRLADGSINETGQAEIKFNLQSKTSKSVAIEYFMHDRKQQKLVLWDQNLSSYKNTNVNLVFSSVSIVLKDTDNELLKNLNFDIFATVTDVLGHKVADERLYENIQTGITGEKILYLVPGNYIMRLRYPNLNYNDDWDYNFSINNNSQTDLTYIVNTLKVGVRDKDGNLKRSAEFRLSRLEKVMEDNDEYKPFGNFNTGDYGYLKLYLPQGKYKIEFRDSQGNYSRTSEFNMDNGTSKDFYDNPGTFSLKVLNSDEDPAANLMVKIYKYSDFRQNKIYENITNFDGIVEGVFTPGYYTIEIESIYRGFFYTLENVNIKADETNNFEYILSSAKIYFEDNQNKNLKNEVFYLFYDNSNRVNPGQKIGSFSTGGSGFAEIYLAPGQYVLKLDRNSKVFPFTVETGQKNILTFDVNGLTREDFDYSSVDRLTDLYPNDVDGDGLTDFQEVYFYETDPYKADSDNDGFNDAVEIKNKFNPNGSGRAEYIKFSYGLPRMTSLSFEGSLAKELRKRLEAKLGKNNIKVNAKDWHTLVNSFIYGGYSVSEIANTLTYGPGQVHPTIPASSWRKKNY